MDQLLLPEDSFNRILASLLRTTRPEWSKDGLIVAEIWRKFGTQRVKPDIYIDDLVSPPVIVECAYGGDRDKDALDRLSKTTVETVVSLAIPKTFKDRSEYEAIELLEQGEQIQYAVLQRELDVNRPIYRFPNSGYLSGTYTDLAALIHLSALPKSRVELIASEVAALINDSGEILGQGLVLSDLQHLEQKVYQNSSLTAQRTVVMLWLDALLVQSYLRSTSFDIEPLPTKESLRVSTLLETWKETRSLNWYSIFAPAIETLELSMVSSRKSTFLVILKLLEAVEIIETARLGRHINIGADIFPKISEDREAAAAFYTMPAASEMLASLLVRKEDRVDWDKAEMLSNIKFVDFACGTGSLIRSSYRRIFEFVTLFGGSTEEFHANMMEQVITATDISPIAAHLTNSSLAMIGDGKPYGKTSIGWVGVGRPLHSGRRGLTTGSLEYLETASIKDLFFDLSGSLTGTDRDQSLDMEVEIYAKDCSFDYIVMNPPYSRSSGGKQGAFQLAGLSSEEQKLCQQRWGQLISKLAAHKNAGMAASFLVLAQKKIKPGGRIGFVLPLTIAFGTSWRKTREMLVTHFEDLLVVANANENSNPESLSADTNMGEILLLATKRAVPGLPKPMTYVALRRPVTRMLESREVASTILADVEPVSDKDGRLWVGNDLIGSRFKFQPRRSQEEWNQVGILNPTLFEYTNHFIDTGELLDEQGNCLATFPCSIVPIDQVFDIGISSSSIGYVRTGTSPRGAFIFEEIQRKADLVGPYRSLWSANMYTQKSFIVQPTHLGRPRQSKQRIERIMETISALHYTQELRLTSQALVVAQTNKAVLGGSAWQSLRDKPNYKLANVFSLWGNSTLGLISHWMKGTRTQMGRSRSNISTIRTIPIPDFRFLNAEKIALAEEEFNRLKEFELMPVCRAHVDPIRQKIDRSVVRLFDLPEVDALDSIGMLRNWWCTEPSVHGNNTTALKLLKDRGLR